MSNFNGHKNWNHWNVSLWINNDEGLHAFAKACIRNTRGKGRKAAAQEMLDQMKDMCGIEKTPDGAPYSVSAIQAAMVGM